MENLAWWYSFHHFTSANSLHTSSSVFQSLFFDDYSHHSFDGSARLMSAGIEFIMDLAAVSIPIYWFYFTCLVWFSGGVRTFVCEFSWLSSGFASDLSGGKIALIASIRTLYESVLSVVILTTTPPPCCQVLRNKGVVTNVSRSQNSPVQRKTWFLDVSEQMGQQKMFGLRPKKLLRNKGVSCEGEG